MRLERLSLEMLDRAISIYWDKAYAQGSAARPSFAVGRDPEPDDLLRLFNKDVVEVQGRSCVRYSMRLGNRNYPFMKLMLQEHILHGEFFFAIDTHDEMEIKPDFPDYEAWNQVRQFNSELKKDIECSFAQAGLDTAAALRQLVQERRARTATSHDVTILVVDDEEDLAQCVSTLLADRGYQVSQVHDGRAGLEAARAMRPGLVLLDYEMPELDGLEVLEALHADNSTAQIPVILTTASRVSLSEVAKADGFLAKPFHEDLLYEIVDRVLAKSRRA